MPRLRQDELENLVVCFLTGRGKVTVWDIEAHFADKHQDCPDGVVLLLSKMRMKGRIKGEIDKGRRCWVWWVEGGGQR